MKNLKLHECKTQRVTRVWMGTNKELKAYLDIWRKA